MPKKCKGKRNALVVTVVAVLLGDIFAGGQNIPAQQKTWNAGDTKRTQMTESATQRMDLTDAFAVILQGATKKFIAGYAVDDSFLMWLAARYGDEKVVRIASAVLDGTEDPEVWYDITGSSIHVLWLMYCRDSGFQQYRLQNVYWKEAGEDGKIVLGFAGDINFADDWYTMEYMNRQTNGIYDCFSEDLLSEMQNVDVMVMNNEFTYAESGSVEAVPGKAYTFRADPEDVELLSVFGTDAVTLANNHVYDYGEEGLLSTLECLRKADIPYTGAGENRKEASKILSFVIGGRKIAIVSATQIERATKYTKEATETEPGVLKTLNPAAFLEVIREADATSDYVIVEVHSARRKIPASSGGAICGGRRRRGDRRTSAPAAGMWFYRWCAGCVQSRKFLVFHRDAVYNACQDYDHRGRRGDTFLCPVYTEGTSYKHSDRAG